MPDRSTLTLHPLARMTAPLLAAGLLTVTIAGCGGGSGGEGNPPVTAATMIRGTVAVGAAVAGASIVVKDSDAATPDLTGTAGADGAYAIDVTSLKPPLLVSAAGTLNGESVSVVAIVPTLSAKADNTANVTSLTNAVAALVAPGGDLNALTSAAAIAAVNATAVANASAAVVNTLKSNPAFAAALGAGFDPLTTAFKADRSGIDSVLDQVSVTVGSNSVAITNLAAPTDTSGAPPASVTLAAAQVTDPTRAPALPASVPAADLPTAAQMAALAKKLEDCLALPIDQRVTLNADKVVTAVSAACNYAPAQWKSDGGNWADRVGMGTLRHSTNTGSKAGAPTIAVVLAARNAVSPEVRHPDCDTQTCVVMNVPMTTPSGKAWSTVWQLGRTGGQWDYVGNQLPYSMFVEHRMLRKVGLNTTLAAAFPTSYFLRDRVESVVRLSFSPDATGAENSNNVRAVVWKGPGLPDAGVVTHRSQTCGTAERFTITNQEGKLNVINSVATRQFWNGNGGADFFLDAVNLDGAALAMPTPSVNWNTTAAPVAQDMRGTAFTGTIPAWSVYTAEIYYYTNTGTTPDQIIVVRTGTPFEPAAVAAAKNWPEFSDAFISKYLKPDGDGAGSITTLDQAVSWTSPSDVAVANGYLFSSNWESMTNVNGMTAWYAKRGIILFRPVSLGDTAMTGYEWFPRQSGTALSTYTRNLGMNPNPRCDINELVRLDADATKGAYREAGLGFRSPDRKAYNQVMFWSN